MESNDDQNLKAINESVGRLVWVRRGNGSWWPGQALVPDEVPENSKKIGTPIKLLGRDDIGVEWHVLEKSKSVKAFRCGDYDGCIEKAKAAAVLARSSKKRSMRCSRRELAINNALEIERSHLVKDEDNLCSSSMSSQELNNVSKVEQKRRRTPNDSEDDGTEGTKRMRGLEDIGKEPVGERKQEMGLVCYVNNGGSMSNGNSLANGNKVCSLSPLKRKVVNECSKRKNRHRQLTKVLESTAMVSVPVTSDFNEGKVSGMEPVELSVVINNNSDSTGENASEHVVGGALRNNKAKDSDLSSLLVSPEDSSDQLYDVPLTGDEKHSAAFSTVYGVSSLRTVLVSDLTKAGGGRSSLEVFVKKDESNGYPQLVNGVEKSTSKWQLKGKRNSRQMSKKQEASRNVEANNNTSLIPSALHEVKIEVKANYSKPRNVPLVSRMSELNGKAIVGHPLTVELFKEGVVKPLVVAQENPLPKKKGKKRRSHGPWYTKKKKPPSLAIKTRRLSTLTGQKMTERSKKVVTTKKAKETVVACIPLKVVFSRINQVLKGSTRQTQQRSLPSPTKA